MLELNKIYNMDCAEGLKLLEDESINFIVTSPPYNLDDKRYYSEYQDNLDEKEYIEWLSRISKELHRVLRYDGNFLFNIGYNNNSRSSYIKIINEFIKNGFFLHETIVWLRKGMPLTEINNLTRDYEFIFLFSKSGTYLTNQKKDQIISNVFKVINKNHNFGTNRACFPVELIRKLLKLFSKDNDVVLDPFMGTGTTALACKQTQRRYVGFEISKEYCDISTRRLGQSILLDWSKLVGEDNEFRD